MRQSLVVTKIAVAVLGGWLAVMPGSVLTIALCMREFDSSGLPAEYSTILAVGWLVMIAGLIGFGHLGDRIERSGRSRVLLVRLGLPLLALSGIALGLAANPLQLGIAWVAAQLPSAAVVTSALALSGTAVEARRRGVLSGLIGAASIVALLMGSIIVRGLQTSLSFAFIAPAILGALFIAPLALSPPQHVPSAQHDERRTNASQGKWWASAWVTFAFASLLLSWATSTSNSYVVMFIENLSQTPTSLVASASTRAVTSATLAAVIASIIGGLIMRGRRSAAIIWALAATAVAVALFGLLAYPTPTGILIFATAFGAGFGMANGVELGLLLFVRHGEGQLGRDLGIFNAMTAVPYVLVPAVATAWLAGSVEVGLRGMFILALSLALVGALMTAGIAVTTRRHPDPTAVRDEPRT